MARFAETGPCAMLSAPLLPEFRFCGRLVGRGRALRECEDRARARSGGGGCRLVAQDPDWAQQVLMLHG